MFPDRLLGARVALRPGHAAYLSAYGVKATHDDLQKAPAFDYNTKIIVDYVAKLW